jgi:hypothetical protein
MLGRLLTSLFGSKNAALTPADRMQNPLADFFFNRADRLIHKWHHYFDLYDRHFAAFRGKSPVVVEIGVSHGGSLQMWREYFGPGCHIVGIDVDPRCKAFEDASTSIMIGDQGDRDFLASVREKVPHMDILIDDGGHLMQQQITTFEELYHHIQPNGIYWCEDTHTSYLKEFGGGYQQQGTFVEYCKALIDRLYGWYAVQPEKFSITPFTKSTYGVHFYNCVVVIEKRLISKPEVSFRGKRSF